MRNFLTYFDEFPVRKNAIDWIDKAEKGSDGKKTKGIPCIEFNLSSGSIMYWRFQTEKIRDNVFHQIVGELGEDDNPIGFFKDILDPLKDDLTELFQKAIKQAKKSADEFL